MGWKANVTLLTAVGAMGWYLYAKGDPLPSTLPAPSLTYRLLPDSIWKARQVKIQRAKLEPIILDLNLSKRSFEISDPTQDVASFALLTSIFRIYDSAQLLDGYSDEELKQNPELIAKVGLDDPRATVEVRYENQTVKIAMGQASFLKDDEIYLRVGERVYRGPKALYTSIQHNPDGFRERVLFTEIGIGGLNKIRVTRRVGEKMVVDAVEKLPQLGYRIVEPRSLRVDMSMVGSLAEQIGGLSVARFVSGTMTKFNDKKPDLIVAVEGEIGSDTLSVFDIGDQGPQSPGPFLARLDKRNVMIEVSGIGLRNLVHWAGLLRARHLLPFGEAAIRRIEIDSVGAGKKLLLVRGTNDKFNMQEPVQGQIAATPVSELIFALAHMEAREFVDEIPESAGLGEGQGYLALRVGSSRSSTTIGIRLGKENKDGLVYARREGEETAVLLPGDIAEKIRRPWLDFVGTQLPKLSVGTYCVEVFRPAGQKALVYINKDGEWRLEGASADSEPHDGVLELADQIRNVRADKALSDTVIAQGDAGIRVVFRQQPYRNSAVLVEYHMFAHGKYVVLAPPKRAGVVYLMRRAGIFRRLYDEWTAK